MKARGVVLAWAAAVLLLTGAIAAVIAAHRPAPVFGGARIAVIGSSLIRNAVPKRGEGTVGLLGNGWGHWRMGMSAASESDVLALTARALDERARVLFVEANPLLFDLAKHAERGRCDGIALELRSALKALQLRVTDAYADRFGKKRELVEGAFAGELDRPLDPAPVRLRHIYPLAIRGPCRSAEVRRLGAQALAGHQMIVLVLPPRSPASERLLGPAQKRELAASAHALAGAMHARLFDAGADGWSDAEFLDGEHLDRRGRAHFVAALRRWWNDRQ